MIGTPVPHMFDPFPLFWLRLRRHLVGVLAGSIEDRKRYIKSRLERRRMAGASKANPQEVALRERLHAAVTVAVRSYKPGYYPGQIDLFVTSDEPRQADPWRKFANTVREYDLTKFGRDELLLGAYTPALAAALGERLSSLLHTS